jgi:hypothetical protein
MRAAKNVRLKMTLSAVWSRGVRWMSRLLSGIATLFRALAEGNQAVCERKYWAVPKPPPGFPLYGSEVAREADMKFLNEAMAKLKEGGHPGPYELHVNSEVLAKRYRRYCIPGLKVLVR